MDMNDFEKREVFFNTYQQVLDSGDREKIIELCSDPSWDYYLFTLLEEVFNRLDFANTKEIDNTLWILAVQTILENPILSLLKYENVGNLPSYYEVIPSKSQHFKRLSIYFQVTEYVVHSLKERVYDKILPYLENPQKIWRNHLTFKNFIRLYQLKSLDKDAQEVLQLLWEF